MGVSVSINSLSALVPVDMSYTFNTNEQLKGHLVSYSNGLSYNDYVVFDNIQDVVISRKNALLITDIKPLSSIFDQTTETSFIGEIAGTFLLSLSANYWCYTGDNVLLDPSLEKLSLSVNPISPNLVNIHTNLNTKLTVDAAYPYVVRTTSDNLPLDQLYRQEFEIEFFNNLISFKTTTPDGDRYLSFGSDNILRACGVMLNNNSISTYIFTPSFVTTPQIQVGHIPTSCEVKYYNDLDSFKNKLTVEVQSTQNSDTNLLVSCNISDITSKSVAPINIALLRSNFTSTGSYSPATNA